MDIPVPIVMAGMRRPWVNMYDSTNERFLLLEMVTQRDTVRTDTLLLAALMSCHAGRLEHMDSACPRCKIRPP